VVVSFKFVQFNCELSDFFLAQQGTENWGDESHQDHQGLTQEDMRRCATSGGKQLIV
jgi:hypothetical protein